MELQPLNSKSETITQVPAPYFPLITQKPGLMSRIFFIWVNPIIKLGDKSKINKDDCYVLPEEEYAENERLTEALKSHKLFRAIFSAHFSLILSTIILGIMIAFCDFSGPIFIRLLIEYLQQDDKPLNYGIIIGVCFSFLVFSNSIMKANNLWLSKKLEIRIKNAICNVIYGKVLIAANIPEGMGVNLLQVDAKKIFECLPKLSQWITCPLQVSLSIYLIAIQVGSAVYAAIGVLVICITLNYIIAEKLGKYSENIMNIRDKRIASSTQMFGNIKMIKAYCWEDYFKKIIHTVRKGELSFLRFLMFLYATAYFFYWAIPGFTAGSVFFYYSVIMQETLTTEKAFVTIMTLNILQDSLQDVPYLVSDFMMCLVSIKRIQSLLDVANLQSLPKGETIDLKKCTFSYGDKNVINEITLHIQKGEFVAIIGPVGSGKSTLLNSIMGELNFKTGSVSINDDLAYAPSLDSWLQNDSLRNNILFGSAYNKKWYDQVIDACCLSQDINSLPDKDMTEIGEKGINLSGGQKARICLARAVYSDKQIYLLDDPLSSVDSHVANHIMNNCFLTVLSKKTRILVTHRLNILDKVDRVIVLDKGTVKEIISPDSLISNSQTQDISETEIQEVNNAQNKLIDEEDRISGKVSLKVYDDYFKFSGGYLAISIGVIAMILWISTRMAGDILLKEWTSNQNDADFYLRSYLIVRVGGGLFVYVRTLALLTVMGIGASKTVHERMINSMVDAPVNLFYDVTPLGRLLNRLSKDLNIIDESISRNYGSVLAEIMNVGSKVAIVLIFFPILCIIVPILLYLSYRVKEKYLNISRELTRLEAVSRSPILNNFGETISGAKIIRTFKQTQNYREKNYNVLNVNSKIQYSLYAAKAWLSISLGVIAVMIILSLVGLIIYLRNEISLGVVGLTLTYILTLPESVIFLVQELTSLENTMIYVERTKEFMNITPESEFVKSSDKNLENWPFIPTIEFKNVQMRYRPNTPLVLKGVNFEIKAGHRVGLVGRTGSGKSSIYLCLLRLVEISSGSILIDGVNIAQIGLKKLRSSLTLVPQDPLVFSGTLQTNLDPLNLKSPAEISKALNEVGLSKYPITYELKSDGSNLSAGERQLISLGRAMLSHTKIILFDEATAGIDQAADLKIQDLICHKFNGCSILTIAHRLNTVLNSDLIIVMHDGQAKEIGSPQELLSKDSMFKNLKDRIN